MLSLIIGSSSQLVHNQKRLYLLAGLGRVSRASSDTDLEQGDCSASATGGQVRSCLNNAERRRNSGCQGHLSSAANVGQQGADFLHLHFREQTFRTGGRQIPEGRVVEAGGIHHAPAGEFVDDLVDELNLGRRVGVVGEKFTERSNSTAAFSGRLECLVMYFLDFHLPFQMAATGQERT